MRFGYFVDAVDGFDAKAFRLAGSEASAMDPQTRICLEQAQASATLRRAPVTLLYIACGAADGLHQGHPLIQLTNWQEVLHCVEERGENEDAATGVYMGVMYTEYLDAILAPQVCIRPLLI